ncbi:MAG: menaquinone biosynthesis protein [Bacteroidia bacterium]|nr:menaquinone biosynthesis protein [Bacteroidia bacterium]
MDPRKVRISIVNYTNTLPFKWAIKRDSILERIDLQEDIPSICAQKLKFGQVDLALVPVALIPELDKYFIETDYCIGADGVVDSVKLYSQVPLAEIKSITLDYQSKSSITLTKVLAKFFWNINPTYLEAKPGFEDQINEDNAAVVIGDRTFSMNGKFNYEYDLAAEWKKFTGLPFVFAAWLSTEKLPKNFIEEFNTILKYGIDHTEQAIDEIHDPAKLSKTLTLEYLTKRINYSLEEKKLTALQEFLKYIKLL